MTSFAVPICLSLPAVDQKIRYACSYWPLTLGNLLLPHRLKPNRSLHYTAPVSVTDRLRSAWHDLFQTSENTGPVPYLYSQSVGTLIYSKIFRGLGINFKNVRHVSHQVEYPDGVAPYVAANRQLIDCKLDGCWKVDTNKVLVELRTDVRSGKEGQGPVLARITDSFIILDVPEAYADQFNTLDRKKMLMVLAPGAKRKAGQPQPAPRAVAAFHAPLDMGRRYGRISGDSNPVHTSKFISNFFGIERPFMQGLCLRNAVVGALSSHGIVADKFSMNFMSPALLGQTFEILIHEKSFVVQDQAGTTVASGKFQGAAAREQTSLAA